MGRSRILLLWPGILCLALAFLGGCNPKVYQNVRIYDAEAYRAQPCEPSIAISPVDPDKLVAGSILSNVHYSTDGGIRWRTKTLKSPHGVYGDPCVVAGPEGAFYYFHLAAPEKNRSSERWLESIVVQRSDDRGKTWNDGSAIGLNPPKDQDKEWAAVDPETGNIYVTWTEFDKYGDHSPDCYSRILFSSSIDRGETWSDPVTLSALEGNCIDSDQTTEGAVPAVGPEGQIYVAWGYDERIYFDRSLDGGETWLEEDILLADQPGGWNIEIPGMFRCNGMPVTATDRSEGPYRGSVYVCWGDLREGEDNANIYLSHSRDGGDTWSPPALVNEDKNGRHQFLPWMAVDPVTGHIYIVYYDREKTEGKKTHVTLAASKDGGRSFRTKGVSNETFTPPGKFVFMGDYNNISAYDGRVRPIWTSYDRGRLSIWTAIIDEK